MNQFFHPNHQNFRFALYFFGFVFLCFLRMEMDRDFVFMTSDGQIKYFQTLQIADGKFQNSECLYPGQELDPDFKYYIFDYPWAFFGVNGMDCAFQYSPYFPSIAAPIYKIFGEKSLGILPLVFFLFSIFLFDKILEKLGVRGWIILVTAFSGFFFSFLSLSALDYAELSMNDLLFLGGIYLFINLLISLQEINVQTPKLHTNFFLVGFILGFSFLLRPETGVGLGLLAILTVFLFYKDIRNISLKNWSLIFLSIFTVVILTSAVNYIYSGNVLGFRATTTVSDMKPNRTAFYLLNRFVSDIWKSDIKVGVFFSIPMIFSLFPVLWFSLGIKSIGSKNYEKYAHLFFLSGFLAILLIPILSPYRAGTHHFGNRYFETAVILAFLGGGLLIEYNLRKFSKYKIYFQIFLTIFLLGTIYQGYKYSREGWKVFRQSAKLHAELQFMIRDSFDQNSSHQNVIIHKSLYTNYLVGPSFPKDWHYLVTSKEMMEKLESKMEKNHITEYLEFEHTGEKIKTDDIPEELFNTKINIPNFTTSDKYKLVKEEEFLDFKLKQKRLEK